MNTRTKQILLTLAAAVIVAVLAKIGTDAARNAVGKMLVNAVVKGETGGFFVENCPKCERSFTYRPGKGEKCAGCGNLLAACGECGDTLIAPNLYQNRTKTGYVCAKHHAQETWIGAKLAEFDRPPANLPPPTTPLAVAARALYEKQVRECRKRGDEIEEVLFVAEKNGLDDAAIAKSPAPVAEAYGFYTRTVLEGDFGAPSVYRWRVKNKPVYVVICSTDGSNGWTELYDADGKPLGYANTEDYLPTWTSKGAARRTVWGEQPRTTLFAAKETLTRTPNATPPRRTPRRPALSLPPRPCRKTRA